MPTLSRIGNVFFYLFIALILIASIGSALINTPFLFSVIRSDSMYPLLTRGDLVFLQPLSADATVKIGDIVLFKTEGDSLASQGWIMHRIIAGDAENGYITKGDANKEPDQTRGKAYPIQREWIKATAFNWGTNILKCPLLGYLPLWAQEYQQSPYLLPGLAFILTIILAVTELQKNKTRKKKGNLNLTFIYMGSGLVISLLLLASMLTTSQKITLVYEVAENQGIIQGSELGILKQGETIERFLAKLKNKSFCPFITIITCHDSQISFKQKKLVLKPSQEIELSFTVTARQSGSYQSPIWIGTYYPFLPKQLLYQLQAKNIWLALGFVSLLPGLPLFLYPFFAKDLRRKTKKEIRRFYRRMKRKTYFHN